MTDIIITDIAPQTVLGIRRRGFYQEQIPAMIMELFTYVEQEEIEIAGMPLFVCHETSVEETMRAAEEGNADIEVAIPIPSPVEITAEGTDGITCYELPGGTMLKAIHKGPYATSEVTYNEVFEWMAAHKKEGTGPIREVYLNDPGEVAEEDILTEIYVPMG
ncbi:GyrI-like domain-containing protein [Methanogenium marinum]|uniref:GyrI-like domain-containing protein n=1 Tax=Methanogenium marinum TaxID=348610 RepID=A0A9Q4KVC4_9EURY|nr:GyrI-like domain-containing protein [Methanogenium marinum]MDE4908917.1 GyrI-like domain-containing protein [Methanogenium marinum]